MTWLFVPSVCAPASEASTSASELPDPTRAASLSWRGKPLQPQAWSRAWRRGGFIRLLSGLTCEPSTLQHGAAQWIASCRAIPAKGTPSPESGSVPMTTDGCSIGRSTCSIKAGLAPSSARTSLGTLQDRSPLPSRHWSGWAAALRAEFSARPRPVQATAGTGSSSSHSAWQTPAAQQFEAADLDRMLARQAECKATGKNGNGFGLTLANEVQIWAREQWATPQARDHFPAHSTEYIANKRADGHGMRNLNDEAAHWPTPAARDHKGENSVAHVTTNGTGRMHMDQLPNFVVHAFQPSLPDQPTVDGQPSSPLRRRLNPLFVEWLMGWPEGLSGFDTAAMASCHSPQPSHGCGCMDCWLTQQRAMLSDLLTIDPPAQGLLL